jgi:hypothetical protein
MGLPDEYKLPARYNDAYHLTGDGVVVNVIKYLAEKVFEPHLKRVASQSAKTPAKKTAKAKAPARRKAAASKGKRPAKKTVAKKRSKSKAAKSVKTAKAAKSAKPRSGSGRRKHAA